MPQDIVLRDLTTPPVKGSISPLISTVPAERDGTRGGVVVEPPPVDPSDDYRFAGSVYVPDTPGGTGTGTQDAAFDFSKFEYLGSFGVGRQDPVEGDYYTPIGCYAPPNGSNGTWGSMFTAYSGANTIGPCIYEFQIPDPATWDTSDDLLSVPLGTKLQGPVEIFKKSTTLNNGTTSDKIGWLRLIDDKLFIMTYQYYNGIAYSDRQLLVCNTPKSMETSVFEGYVSITPGGRTQDQSSHYCMKVPESRVAQFNGNTYLSGTFVNVAIVGRTSLGPSLFGWKPNEYTTGTTLINQEEFVCYHLLDTPPFYKYSDYNIDVLNHYESLLGMEWPAWVNVPKGGVTAQSTYNATVVNEAMTLKLSTETGGPLFSGYDNSNVTKNRGVYPNTIIVKSSDGLTTYTEGVDYTKFVYDGDYGSWGYEYMQAYGRTAIQRVPTGSIPSQASLLVSYTYLTKRYDDLTYYPKPSFPLDTSSTQMTRCACAFFVPNTDTILFLGNVAGHRYGMDYKDPSAQSSPNTKGGGPMAVDDRDRDDFYWLMNVNDIFSAPTTNEVPIYEYGIFDNNRFSDKLLSGYPGGAVVFGAFDPVQKYLYLCRDAVLVNGGSRKQVVSVYKINT